MSQRRDPRQRPRIPRRSTLPLRWLAGIAAAVVTIGAVVLVVLALLHARGEAPTGTPRPVPTFDAPQDSTASPTPTPTVTPSTPGADERFLAIGTGAMWRATAGGCGGPAPVIERSVDGGATWTDVTPTYRGIAQVLSLDPLAGDQAEIVAGMGAGCEVQALRTFTGGEYWEPYADVLAASTYLAPQDPASVVTPAGAVAAPCPSPWGLRSSRGTVGLICDGTAYQRASSTWQQVGTDAVAVAIRDGAVVAVTAAQATAPAAAAVSPDGLRVWSGDTLSTIR